MNWLRRCTYPEPNPEPVPDPIPDNEPEPTDVPVIVERILVEAVPLPDELFPETEGCLALIEATAAELGTTSDGIQISIGSAVALNPNIQPCQVCEKMVDNAAVLKGVDDEALTDALIEVFNELAPPDVPISEDILTETAMRLSERPSYFEDNPKYTMVIEYIDALVAYIDVLENEMGAPVGNSVEFAMDRYGSVISQAEAENPNVTIYIVISLMSLAE